MSHENSKSHLSDLIDRFQLKILMPPTMSYRSLGRSSLAISAVGFGTCQLRMVTQQQAIDTLKQGFSLGVNFVHTAPDYEGAEDVVAAAVEESGKNIIVFTQGYGDISHFEWLFEMACLRSGKKQLDVFGIACVEDRELLNENVWGRGGMIEFLLNKKKEGRLKAIFAESHGTPEYIAKLIRSNVFDAVLIAYNSLGFHALSYFPEPPGKFENIPRNKLEIFPLAKQYNTSIMLMKSLAGGLMCPGKAFPPYARFTSEKTSLTAGDILKYLLRDPNITAVVPGTASVEEAVENARAGFTKTSLTRKKLKTIDISNAEMLQSLCSRCGHCDSLCSQKLPVSWLFRDAYVATIRAETFETLDRLQYFHLHPQKIASCNICENVSCRCPDGIDIPGNLIRIHEVMLQLKARGVLAHTPFELEQQTSRGPWGVKCISAEIPRVMKSGSSVVCRLWWENAGAKKWPVASRWNNHTGLYLHVDVQGSGCDMVSLRHDVEPGTRTHFTFSLNAPDRVGEHRVSLLLKTSGTEISDEGVILWTYHLKIVR